MADLQVNGSRLVPGFMRPEGIVVSVGGALYKKVFKPEETKWRPRQREKKAQTSKRDAKDYSHLCQPIRLEKLLSRDESFSRGYPESLAAIIKAYVADLTAEGQIAGDKDEVRAVTKEASGQLFKFVKAFMSGDRGLEGGEDEGEEGSEQGGDDEGE